MEYATRACELSQWKKPNAIDTLAVAAADTGDFKTAVKWEAKYLQSENRGRQKSTRTLRKEQAIPRRETSLGVQPGLV